ncbi:MAG: type II toxin-antitoxin system HicB family antitoxin [Moraxellaceae bacterium]|nr:type II toxin-antitoxin system HicB family antitoxin [Moraxellaceae bacterium]
MNDITIARHTPPYPFEAYTHVVRPLTTEEGGGFLISFPELSGCISDGETVEEAIINGRDVFACYVSALIDMGREVPAPNSNADVSGKFLVRLPKSLHAQLANRSKREGVSLNTLVVSYVAAGVASHV